MQHSIALTSTGSGPTLRELREFLAQVPVGVDDSTTRLGLSYIPRDRPFDSDSWTIRVNWTTPLENS